MLGNTAALLTVAHQALMINFSSIWEKDQHRRQEQRHGQTCFPLSTTCLNLNMFQMNTHISQSSNVAFIVALY